MAVSTDTGSKVQQIERYLDLSKDRLLVPRILAMVHEAMPELAPELAQVETPDDLKKSIEANKTRFVRTSRRQLHIESFDAEFFPDVETHDISQAI